MPVRTTSAINSIIDSVAVNDVIGPATSFNVLNFRAGPCSWLDDEFSCLSTQACYSLDWGFAFNAIDNLQATMHYALQAEVSG